MRLALSSQITVQDQGLRRSVNMSTSSHSEYRLASEIPFDHQIWMGVGSVGAVDKVMGNTGQFTGHLFARKTIRLSSQSTRHQEREAELQAIQNEIHILNRISHQHVIRLIATYSFQDTYAIVMAPCAQTNLEQYLQYAISLTDRSELQKNSHWFACLISGLHHIHRLGIQHRDIKPTNILIYGSNVLLADFGIATLGLEKTRTTELGKPRARTRAYCAPEVEQGHSRSQAADIFSLGAVILELMCVHASQVLLAKLRSRMQSPDGFAYAEHASEVVDWMDDSLRGVYDASPWESEVLCACRKMLNIKHQQRPSSADIKARLSFTMPPGRCGCTPSKLDQALNHKLKRAYARGHMWTAEYLTQCGAVLSLSETLVAAAEGGLEPMVKDLLGRDGHLLSRHGAIQKASRGGSRRIVQLLLDDGVDVNEIDDDQTTALCEAARKGHKDIIQLLLEKGADVDSAGPGKQTALSVAAGNGFDNVVKLLLQHNPRGLSVALERAAENAHEATVRLLLESKARDDEGVGPLQRLLFKAAQSGHTPIVRLLLEHGADVRMRDSQGSTAMHKAVSNGKSQTVLLLLGHGIDIDAQDSAGDTVLHIAAGGGDNHLVKLLLDRGPNIHVKNGRGLNALGSSAEKGREAALKTLLGHEGPFWALREDVRSFFYAGPRKASQEVQRVINRAEAMVTAAENRHENLVQVFLNQKPTTVPYAALLVAVERGNKTAVSILLVNDIKRQKSQEDFRLYSVPDTTEAFALAMRHGRFGSGDDAVRGDDDAAEARRNEAMALLFDDRAFADDQDRGGRTTLHKAASAGYEDLTRILLDSGLDVNNKDNKGWTPLHAAAANGKDRIFHLLLNHGGLVDPRDKRGETPLSLAAGRGHGHAIQKLLRAGANPHAVDENQLTILYKTATSGCAREISSLLKARLPINGVDARSRTPLFQASARGHVDVVRKLIEGGAKVNLADIVRVTPLHVASRHGHKEVVEHLLKARAKVGLKDFGDETALHKAAEYGHYEVIEMLLKHGSPVNTKNRGGRWVREEAQKKKDNAFQEALADIGLDTDPGDEGRETPLHKAVGGGSPRATALLLYGGANAYAKNKKGQTALDKNRNREVGTVFVGWVTEGNRRWPAAPSDTD
ncbi:hypothetical protein BFJ69_g7866 [Fusarium oxysporum]|uniref:Protein kinase domain-containing protein n=1 Tax=Fusarium oxysporum TaxID=5507 RepID=A0A420N4T0_FUSOX|nr:hypothetical protein BFJ69_g7866 [Fusarium oxysporum]